MADHYILNPDHTVSEADLFTWAAQFEKLDRTVRKTVVRGRLVSTVFLGLNHNYFDSGPPLIFETMVFAQNSWADDFCERCSTWEEALVCHERGIRYARFSELYDAYAWLLRAYYKARIRLTRAVRRDQ